MNGGRAPLPDRGGAAARYSRAGISKMRTRLGYEPTHRIDEGLAEAMAWYVRDLG